MTHNKMLLMTKAALLTAMIYVLTAYLHIPVGNGYVHLGDGLVYLAACALPLPYALFAGTVGSVLADCLSGFPLWAPATGIIKALTVLCFRGEEKRILCPRNLLALLPACLLCAGGYYLYEALLFGSFVSPLASIPGNLLQSLCSAGIFLLCAAPLNRLKS